MIDRRPLFLTLILFAFFTSACGSSLPFDVSLEPTMLPPVEEGSEFTFAAFARRVANAGARFRLLGAVSQPFFTVDGHVMQIEGQSVQVYEYQAVADAESAAAAVTPDGSAIAVGAEVTKVDWASTPHFYRRDRVIVVYVGQDDSVLGVLDSALGSPFAGGRAVLPSDR